MAAIVLRLRHHRHRHRHHLVRLYSSDNPSDSDPAAKLFADIKARLRQSPPRRPPAVPPPPPSPPPSSRPPPPPRPTKAASLDEIRKHLSEFRSRTAPPNPPPPPSFSFSEIYKNSVPGPASNRPEPPFSFDVIRESLRNIRKPADAVDTVKSGRPPSPTLSPESLQALKDGLKVQRTNVAEPVKDSIFQTKPADSSYRMDYLKIYSHKELGEKLRQLRPVGVGKDKKDWFSLAELNERLKKVKAMDEEKYERRPVGVTFRDLRECLMMMKETGNKKDQVNLSE